MGLGDAWAPPAPVLGRPSAANRQVLHDAMLHLEGTKWQYLHGVADPDGVAPESYTLDAALLERPGNKDIQLDLFLDYANNLKRYPDFQAFFRQAQVPTLVIWGRNDPFFIPPGARGVPPRQPWCRGGIAGHRPLRAGDARRRTSASAILDVLAR